MFSIVSENECYNSNNLKDFQKILATNLALWINKFISNLNIHIAESPEQYIKPQKSSQVTGREMQPSYLPIQDYISCSNGSDDICFEDKEGETQTEIQRDVIANELDGYAVNYANENK